MEGFGEEELAGFAGGAEGGGGGGLGGDVVVVGACGAGPLGWVSEGRLEGEMRGMYVVGPAHKAFGKEWFG